MLRVLRRIVGAPDYQAYVEHCQAAGHPLRLSEREYVAEFFAAKGKGVRCC
ncbi:MAG TPA: CstA-like transporter-associated (seleno)protein [Gemmatimonadales bacterium]|nr:CstA-like transporter-associated (seleno)protein [Gemmatimonadales bacterium]